MVQIIALFSIMLLILHGAYIFLARNFLGNTISNVQQKYVDLKLHPIVLVIVMMAYVLYMAMIKYEFTLTDAIILGIILHGVHEMLNAVMFTNWSLMISSINTLWGGLTFGFIAFIYKRFIS